MDDIDEDRNIGTFRSCNSNGHLDDRQPAFKKRRCQDSETDNCDTESTETDICETESTVDSDDSEESDDESEEDETGDFSEEDGSSSELEDNAAYQDWLEAAKEATKDMWNEKHEKYIDSGHGRRSSHRQSQQENPLGSQENLLRQLQGFPLQLLVS